MAPVRDHRTLDIFDWTPKAPVPRVAEEVSRSATLEGRLCRLMAASLKDCGKSRGDVAKSMSDYLGEPVSKDMLDKYVAESSSDHVINLPRFIALIQATGDMSLLQGVAEIFGYSILPTEYVAAAEESMLAAQIEALEQKRRLARKTWNGRGIRP